MSSTTDPALRSFIDVPPDGDFPIQNLPWGVFVPPRAAEPRVGVAIGDSVLDLALLEQRGCFEGPQLRGKRVFGRPALNDFMALGPAAWREARQQISRLLRHGEPTLRDDTPLRDMAVAPLADVRMCLPCEIGAFTDFYCSLDHARNVGRLFRGESAPLPPNLLHMPIAYHGRASSIVVSGTDICRPNGQYILPDQDLPAFGPTQALDFELEVGVLIGQGNERGSPVSIARAQDRIFGFVLVNDWSARDIQRWECTPLGPFLGKNFATSISPWVVPLEALEPFRCQGPPQQPAPPAYLRASGPQSFDIQLEVELHPAGLEEPVTICRSNCRHLYWTPGQMVAHHTVGGCNLRSGDLLATGTVSGPTPESRGCLLELTQDGRQPLWLPDGSQRGYLHDHDTVVLRGWCERGDLRIGLGTCGGRVLPARVQQRAD